MQRLVTTKRIKRLLICIVVGLITSVGIAWVAVVSIDKSKYWITTQCFTSTDNYPGWVYQYARGSVYIGLISWSCAEGTPSYFDELEVTKRKGPSWSRVSQHSVADLLKSTNYDIDDAWGWPMVCLYSKIKEDYNTKKMALVYGIRLDGTTVRSSVYPRLLPTRPICFGLLVNTVLYATTTWFVITPLVRLRNSIRRKRGLCIYCRYNVRDLPMCPECGSEVSTK